MAKKNVYQKQPKPKDTDTKPGEIPTFKSPAKSTWGRVTIIVIIAAMVLIPLISLIVMLATKN